MHRVFIRTNNKQLLGAMIARYAIRKNARAPVEVDFINVDEMPEFERFAGKTFLRYGKKTVYDRQDLQSFTLAAFAAPSRMGYQERAVVIDPDVFALADIGELFRIDLGTNTIAARPKRDGHDTSVVLLDCAKLRHWDMDTILQDLAAQRVDYGDWMLLKKEKAILPLAPEWNSWDRLDEQTKILHTTNRLTQPWKTGLPIDFTRNDPGKLWGVVPRRWTGRITGSWPSRYQPHPDKNIERFFFRLLKMALADGAISEEMIKDEMAAGHVRPDALRLAQSA